MIRKTILLWVCIAGAILPFAFAPAKAFFIAFLSPVILLLCWQHATPKQAFYRGLCFGLGFFGVGTSWVYISIHHFGNANVALAALITLIFIFYLALFPALLGCFFKLIFKNNHLLTILLAFPSLWVISEYLRSELFTGFPWLLIGNSQVNTWLSGYAPLVGVYGISFIVIFICGCFSLVLTHKNWQIKIMSIIFIIIICVTGKWLTGLSWTTPAGPALQVSLVQGNITQAVKWHPAYLPKILQIYQQETEKHWDSQVIVWPEAAIPIYPQPIAPYLQALNQAAKQHGAALIIGTPIYHKNTQQSFNGLMVLGNGQGLYLKRHLVPFGEYIPLKPFYGRFMQYFSIPLSDLSAGPSYQTPLTVTGHLAAAFICYEIAYPPLVLNSVQHTQFIVVISDDSWFGESMASAQQLQMAQMRAEETGRYILYSTNTGITAIINPHGTIEQQAPENRQTVLTGKIIPMMGNTPLMWWP